MHDRTDIASPERQAPAYPKVRALCCDCGTLRTTTRRGGTGEGLRDHPEFGRCLVWRKCATCSERTRHAWLRDDLLEEERRPHPTLSEVLSPLVTEAVERLRACGVRVWWKREDRFKERQVGVLRQWLDDNTWHIELNRAAHIVVLAGILEGAWCLVAASERDLGGDGWRSVAGTPECPPYRYRMLLVPQRTAARS